MANTFATDLPAGESPKSRIASCDTTATPTEVAVVAIDPELVRHMGAIRTLLGLVLLVLVIIGSLVGMSLPFLLSRLRLDPATASGPLVTSISDAIGGLIYFSIATMVLDL